MTEESNDIDQVSTSGSESQTTAETVEAPVNTAPVKKKRQMSTEAKAKCMENLQKAREQRAANRANLTKYPKAKRDRAKEMYEADIAKKSEEKARALAEKIIEDQKTKEELAAFRRWKEEQKASANSSSDVQTPPKKRATKRASAQDAENASASTGRGRKSQPQAKPRKRQAATAHPEPADPTSSYLSSRSYNFDDYLA